MHDLLLNAALTFECFVSWQTVFVVRAITAGVASNAMPHLPLVLPALPRSPMTNGPIILYSLSRSSKRCIGIELHSQHPVEPDGFVGTQCYTPR
jgi:hypothetical protein